MEEVREVRLMPRILRKVQKNTPTEKKLEYSDTNRHKIEKEDILSVPGEAVNNRF